MRIALILSDCLMIYIGGPIDYPLLYSSSVIRLLIVVIEEQVYVWVAVLSELSSLHDTRRSHLILAICHLSEEHCKNFPPLSLPPALSVFFSHLPPSLSLIFSWRPVKCNPTNEWACHKLGCCCHGDECRATHAQHSDNIDHVTCQDIVTWHNSPGPMTGWPHHTRLMVITWLH